MNNYLKKILWIWKDFSKIKNSSFYEFMNPLLNWRFIVKYSGNLLKDPENNINLLLKYLYYLIWDQNMRRKIGQVRQFYDQSWFKIPTSDSYW